MKTGYIPATIQADHYILGGTGDNIVPKVVLSPTGQWTPPPFEAQSRNGIETNSCTGYGLLNCVEILGKQQGFDFNLSERFMALIAGTDPRKGGNDPHTVAEALRHYGAIAEADLPFDDTIKTPEEFYSFKGNDEKTCRDTGEQFTEAWDFMHTWVYSGFVGNKQELMMEALKYSPLGVAGPAWFYNPDTGLFYSPQGQGANHWFTIIGYVEGKYWIIDDSYLYGGEPLKHLEWDFDFACAKRYHFVRNEVWKKQPWFMGVLSGLAKFFGLK